MYHVHFPAEIVIEVMSVIHQLQGSSRKEKEVFESLSWHQIQYPTIHRYLRLFTLDSFTTYMIVQSCQIFISTDNNNIMILSWYGD